MFVQSNLLEAEFSTIEATVCGKTTEMKVLVWAGCSDTGRRPISGSRVPGSSTIQYLALVPDPSKPPTNADLSWQQLVALRGRPLPRMGETWVEFSAPSFSCAKSCSCGYLDRAGTGRH